MTGGGSGGQPMFFLTDAWENRLQRMAMGKLLRQCGLIVPGDLVISMHTSGSFYRYVLIHLTYDRLLIVSRSLDLTAETVENAGGTIFCAGHAMPHAEVARVVSNIGINVISGDSSQILQFALYVSSLPDAERQAIRITKAFYTSEPLVRSQRAYLNSVFGDELVICSSFGSAEAGPWAVMNPAITGYAENDDSADFIFDTRDMTVEVLPPAVLEESADNKHGKPLPDGEVGVFALTSLQRLRNPLIRYLTGDVGSVHPLPETKLIDPEEAQHLKVFRMQGRDQRFSFEWQGEYIEFAALRGLIQSEGLSVLQWQIIRSVGETLTHHVEIRLLRGQTRDKILSDEDVVQRLKSFCHVGPDSEPYFQVTFVSGLQGFERSKTGNKVMRFVDIPKS